MVGVVILSKFTLPFQKGKANKDFSGMIDYIDREEAIENDYDPFCKVEIEKELEEFDMFSGMLDYMDRKKARNESIKDKVALFTNEKDELTLEEKAELKNRFNAAQEKGSVMWNDVISFDNEWLKEHGIYSGKSKLVDTQKIRRAVRESTNEMMKLENISGLWCADIHYNTNNIHVHVATVEENPTRERGKRKGKTIGRMKSKVVNEITDQAEIYRQINDLIRKNIVDSKKQMRLSKDKEVKKLFKETYKMLPKNRRYWSYNYEKLKETRPNIDRLSQLYIEKYQKNSFKELKELLKKQEQILKDHYGGDNKYCENKLGDLYTRMGNAVLKEMKEYDKEVMSLSNKPPSYKKQKSSLFGYGSISYGLKRMKYALKSEYDEFKNQISHEELIRDIERSSSQYEY